MLHAEAALEMTTPMARLRLACKDGDLALVRNLLMTDVCADRTDQLGRSLLYLAAEGGHDVSERRALP